jgi:TRAP-type uncharacterized transport system substrate-binding protein
VAAVDAKRAGRTLWAYVKIYAPAIALLLGGFWLAFQFVDPAPPRKVTIAAGSVDGAYSHFAQRYRAIFAREGIELVVRRTRGSVENLSLLRDKDNDVNLAFVQGGVATQESQSDEPSVASQGSAVSGAGHDGSAKAGSESDSELEPLLALGSVYFEPLWVFHRLTKSPTQLRNLRGKRIAIGSDGSGTRAVAVQLLKENAVGEGNSVFVSSSGSDAAIALAAGELDAVFLVASPASAIVLQLLETPGVFVMNFERAEAYTRKYPFLSNITLPQGAIDLALDIPSADVHLLAPSANLVISERLHPAIIDLVLQAATEVHGKGGLFEDYGQFPSPEYIDFELSDEAKRFYKSGPPFLLRYLPFWAATLVDRLLVMLLPVVALLIPLMRLMPPVYQWRMRARVYRWYKELLATDPTTVGDGPDASVEARLADLDRIEDEVSKVHVPMSFVDQLYHLRMHIQMVRQKLRDLQAARSDAAPAPDSCDNLGSVGS